MKINKVKKTVESCKEFILGSENFILLENSQNRGVSFSRNLGIGRSRGEYILFVDADGYDLDRCDLCAFSSIVDIRKRC